MRPPDWLMSRPHQPAGTWPEPTRWHPVIKPAATRLHWRSTWMTASHSRRQACKRWGGTADVVDEAHGIRAVWH